MTSQENALNWFEISVSDFARAKKFYETIFDIKMETMNMQGSDMAFFPGYDAPGRASGALVKSEQHIPSGEGVKIYLNGNPDLAVALGKVQKAGGQVTMPKTSIDQFGFMAFFVDTEGNTVALHSNA